MASIQVPGGVRMPGLVAAQREEGSSSWRLALPEDAPVVVVMEGSTERVVLGSRRLDALWGLAADAAGEERWPARRADGRPLPLHDWPLARAIREDRGARAEPLEILRGDGTSSRVLLDSAPLHDASGRVVAAVGLLRSDARARGGSLDRLDHALRTPLTALQTRLYLARAHLPPGHEADAHLEAALAEADRLARVVRGLRLPDAP